MSESMQKTAHPSVEDAYKHLNLVPNPDGSVTRLPMFPTRSATSDIDPTQTALSKDIPLDPAKKTFIRLFRPVNPPPKTKLPFVLYFHGGGFVIMSSTTSIYHDPCEIMAGRVPALIASVEYRLAPEHRLPAAYDDAMDALEWAKAQARDQNGSDPWLKEYADFSRVFLMGSSAGANMVFHLALRALDLDLDPVKIVGLIMNEPFFGGTERTGSEIKNGNDKMCPLHVLDLFWSLALPEGTDRGHEYCDCAAVASGPQMEKIGRLPTSVVRGYSGDPLFDKQVEFAGMLETRGVNVLKQFVDGGHHAVEAVDPSFAEPLYDDFRDFINAVAAATA